ncbi:MAG: hypothetical protein AABM67_19335 [Acidobacteriota bacterium]
MTTEKADPTNGRALMHRIRPAAVLVYCWLVVLFIAVLFSAQTAYRQSLRTEEYAYACDSFGYLRMAKEIRQAVPRREFPQFKLESSQTRLLIDFMRSRNVPLPQWEELVAPHAHHYFPESGSVGVQYPPGTGLTLAMFPEGKAVYGLNRAVVLVLLLTGIGALAIAAWKQAWVSAGLVVLAIQLGFIILVRIGAVSFSINSSLIPILMSGVLVLVALRLEVASRHRLALLSALGAGVLLGFATLVRLPTVLLAPGFLILLWPKSWRVAVKSLPAVFVLGVVLVGIIPDLAYQHVIAGSWYLPTYGRIDATLPTLERVRHNFTYYFGDGFATLDNWALIYALAGFVSFAILIRRTGSAEISNRLGISWKRLGLAGLFVWLVPTVFFLSHATTGLHYSMPAIFGAVTLIGLGSLGIEATQPQPARKWDRSNVLCWLAVAVVLFCGVAALNRAWGGREKTPAPSQPVTHAPVILPAELLDARAWIWADVLTGTLWYYNNKPAFKIQFSDKETRAMIFRFVFDRGERQYLIQDSERMQPFIDEIVHLGGRLEPRGKIEDAPYFLIEWPQSGPEPVKIAVRTEPPNG